MGREARSATPHAILRQHSLLPIRPQHGSCEAVGAVPDQANFCDHWSKSRLVGRDHVHNVERHFLSWFIPQLRFDVLATREDLGYNSAREMYQLEFVESCCGDSEPDF